MSPQSLAARYRIGIDTGGTFTDIVSVDTVSGTTHVTKVASTPANPAIGLVRGMPAEQYFVGPGQDITRPLAPMQDVTVLRGVGRGCGRA